MRIATGSVDGYHLKDQPLGDLRLAGLYAPNHGDVYFADRRLRCPFRARALGIEVIHQTPDLAEGLDVSSNIFLGSEIGWPCIVHGLKVPNRRRMEKKAACKKG